MRNNRLMRYQERMGYLFIAMPILLFLIFFTYPALRAIYLSLTQYDILRPPRWIGLRNYRRLLNDDLFFITLRNIIKYVLMYVPGIVVLSVLTALGLNKGLRGTVAFRTIYYLPGLTSSIGAATVWIWLLNPSYGLVNQILGYVGIRGPAWLAHSSTAMYAIVIVTLWQGLGTNMILYLAGLQGIPLTLYEAAGLDGANAVQKFRYITWPMLVNTTYLVVTLSCIGAFQLFDQAYAMTQGGPGHATRTPVYMIYQSGFNELQMGYASAMAVVLFMLIFVFSAINTKLSRQE